MLIKKCQKENVRCDKIHEVTTQNNAAELNFMSTKYLKKYYCAIFKLSFLSRVDSEAQNSSRINVGFIYFMAKHLIIFHKIRNTIFSHNPSKSDVA